MIIPYTAMSLCLLKWKLLKLVCTTKGCSLKFETNRFFVPLENNTPILIVVHPLYLHCYLRRNLILLSEREVQLPNRERGPGGESTSFSRAESHWKRKVNELSLRNWETSARVTFAIRLVLPLTISASLHYQDDRIYRAVSTLRKIPVCFLCRPSGQLCVMLFTLYLI